MYMADRSLNEYIAAVIPMCAWQRSEQRTLITFRFEPVSEKLGQDLLSILSGNEGLERNECLQKGDSCGTENICVNDLNMDAIIDYKYENGMQECKNKMKGPMRSLTTLVRRNSMWKSPQTGLWSQVPVHKEEGAIYKIDWMETHVCNEEISCKQWAAILVDCVFGPGWIWLHWWEWPVGQGYFRFCTKKWQNRPCCCETMPYFLSLIIFILPHTTKRIFFGGI